MWGPAGVFWGRDTISISFIIIEFYAIFSLSQISHVYLVEFFWGEWDGG